MIPAAWEPYHRDDDGELVGYLEPGADDTVVPRSLLGTPLGPPDDRFAAEQTLEQAGLSYLAETWLLSEPDGSERRVLVVEVDAARAVLTDAGTTLVVGAPQDLRAPVEVELPTDRLRRR